MFVILQLFLLLLLFLGIAYFIKSKYARILLSIIFSLFVILQLASYYFGGSLIDYKFYEHMNLKDVWSLRGFYSSEIIIGIVSFLLLTVILFYFTRYFRKKLNNALIGLLIIVVPLVGLSINGGVLNNLYHIYSIKNSDESTFDNAMNNLGIDPDSYVKPNELTAESGKNIIVISLESLENGFLNPPHEQLTPNLQQLAEDYTKFDMVQTAGSDYTEASIYSSITGVPTFFRSSKNKIFQRTRVARVDGISHLGMVLKTAGYDMTYFLAKKEFSGVNNMLNSFGFKVKSEVDLSVAPAEGFWGLHDKDLFEAVEKEISEKAKAKKPFAIFLNTISGHFPNGVYDERMEAVLQPQNSDLEFMISAVDHFVGNLFDYLEKEQLLENTVVYIFPDHLFMGSSSEAVNSFPDERGLYLITTAPKETLPFNSKNTLYQIDLPRIIINGAGIKSNVKFISDFVEPERKEKFINENINNFLSLNEPKIERFDYSNEIRLSITKYNEQDGYQVTLSQEDGFSKSFENIKKHKLYRVFFDKNMNFYKFAEVSKKDGFWRGNTAGVVFSISYGRLYGYLLKGKLIGVAKQGDEEILFNEQDIDIFENWLDVAPWFKTDPNTIKLKSTGINQMKINGPGYIYTGLQKHDLGRGLNVLTIQNNVYNVDTFDTYEYKADAKKFVTLIDSLVSYKTRFVIVGHNSSKRELNSFNKELVQMGMPLLAELEDSEAYIGYWHNNGYIIEEVDANSVSLDLAITYLPSASKEHLKNDRSRFIAHAGGMIGGKKSTNSLEALNESYKNGFRYFELDILTTSNGKFVASHDWKSWVTNTNFTGGIPPSESEFLQQKIFGQYTPMNMEDINNWFKAHPDAVLVSDKINEPRKFAEQFVDKSRLMMEVFSVEAFDEAKSLGLKGVLLSVNVFRDLEGDKFEKLKEMGVEYLAISRRMINDNRDLLLKLKEAGIKVYVFHVRFDQGRHENYVFDYEIGIVYGMYADLWGFPDISPEEE